MDRGFYYSRGIISKGDSVYARLMGHTEGNYQRSTPK